MSDAVSNTVRVTPAAPAPSVDNTRGGLSGNKRRVPNPLDGEPGEPASDGVVRRDAITQSGSAVLKRSISECRGLGGGALARARSFASGVPRGRPTDACYDADKKIAYVMWNKLGSGTYGNVFAAHRYAADERPLYSAADMFERASSANKERDGPTPEEDLQATASAVNSQRSELLTARQMIEAAALNDGPLSPRLKRSRSASRSPTPTAAAEPDAWRSRSAHVAPWEPYGKPNCVFKMLRKTDNNDNDVDDDVLIEEAQREFYTVRLLIEQHGRRSVDPLISRPLDFVIEYANVESEASTEDERAAAAVQPRPIRRAGLVYSYHQNRIDLNRWMRTFFWQTWAPAYKSAYWLVALEIGARILEALGLLHSTDIVHRDVKAANILVTPRQSKLVPDVQLTDFGFSFALRPNDTLRRFDLDPGYLVDLEVEHFIDKDELPRQAMRYNTTYFVRDPNTYSVRQQRPPPAGWPAARDKDISRRVHDRLFPVNEACTAFPAFDLFAAAIIIQRLFDPTDYPPEPQHFEIRETVRMPPDSLIHILRDMTRSDFKKRKSARTYALELRVLSNKLHLRDEVERIITPPTLRR